MRQRDEPLLPILARIGLRLGQEAEPDQRIVQLVCVGRVGPRLLAHARDRRLVEPADLVGGLRIEPAPAHHRLRAALLERRIVEIGVRPRSEHLARERRGLGQIARDDPDLAALDIREQPLEPLDIHRLVEAVGDGLRHERMVGHFALADQILGAGDLIGEDRADQVLGHHAHELRRHLLAAAEARQRERHARDPAPARAEHRRIEQRLDEEFPHRLRIEIARHVGEVEAVRGGERQHDVVFGRRGLKLEVELAAEALAQREPQARLMRLP